MYSLRKSKKGFTLIELMVVVAIIGVLSLLGLRMYTGQREKAKNVLVKANATSIQTLIIGAYADMNIDTEAQLATAIGANDSATNIEGMVNPYSSSLSVYNYDGVNWADAADALRGKVSIRRLGLNRFEIQGRGTKSGELIGTALPARK